MFVNNLQGEFGGEFITDGEISTEGEVFQRAVCITETTVAGITMPGFTGAGALLVPDVITVSEVVGPADLNGQYTKGADIEGHNAWYKSPYIIQWFVSKWRVWSGTGDPYFTVAPGEDEYVPPKTGWTEDAGSGSLALSYQGKTLAAGTRIFGQITSMEVVTGIVQLFKNHTQGVN